MIRGGGGDEDLRFGVLSSKIRGFLNKIQREFVNKMNMSKQSELRLLYFLDDFVV